MAACDCGTDYAHREWCAVFPRPTINDGQYVTLDGKPYQVKLGAPGCGGPMHYHTEPHADGRVPTAAHHHHEPRCELVPRQLALIPLWEAPERHVHDYQDNACSCGASRNLTGQPGRYGGEYMVRYRIPADADHPDGWSYQRSEVAEREDRWDPVAPGRLTRTERDILATLATLARGSGLTASTLADQPRLRDVQVSAISYVLHNLNKAKLAEPAWIGKTTGWRITGAGREALAEVTS